MATKKFGIKTFEAFSKPVIEFQKRILDERGEPMELSPGRENPTLRGFNSFSIDIHELKDKSGSKKPLRSLTSKVEIELTPDWINKEKFDKKIMDVLNNQEEPDDVLVLSARLFCPKLNYVIASRHIPLKEINAKKPIRFGPINLEDISGKIEVQSELIRGKNANPTTSYKAFSKFTIISKNNNITFYVDEIEAIGSNALQISPGDTGDNLFIFKNTNPFAGEPPTLIYDKSLKFYFNGGDDYETVQAILILIGQPYCEQLLKWIIYGTPNYSKEEHQVIIRLIGELCDVREKDFEVITHDSDYEAKTRDYLKLSDKLFNSVQKMDKGWQNMLAQIIKNEKNGKV